MAELILVVGGTRSGKSALAERLVAGAPSVTYVATMRVDDGDAELAGRVAIH
jgi:adenosyl cobinamide kinase/adenosyl cobinamide phosphate guanylyltransferase